MMDEDYKKFIEGGVSKEIEEKRKVIRPGKIKPIHLGERDEGWYTLGSTGKKVLDVDSRLDTVLADVVASLIEVLIEKGILERHKDPSQLTAEHME
jgi:hypothetical protein